ncbi:MAG: pyruvate kinase [Eubacteriales bacterium]|nr:pyruvate kinase [Eubacteriales bacterium]
MKKTKIICTMGPNTNDREVLRRLMQNGMDVARFNFSHGDYEEQGSRIKLLKELRKELDLPIAMLLDTKGPEIRTGCLADGKKVTLVEGEEFVLTTEDIVGDAKRVSVTEACILRDLEVGNTILIDDGLISLSVIGLTETDITCRINNGGELGEKKGINIPNVKLGLPAVTEKDRADILFGIKQDFDFIAASFIRNAQAVEEIRTILRDNGGAHIQIIAKIENAEGIENIDSIIEAADGIMVARGDMGVEVPEHEVPYIQKRIIRKCKKLDKPVITATQMLDSMIRNPRPTRAEVTDVANAIYDGTDGIMLSGETAMGKYPVEALQMMVKIAESTEQHLNYKDFSVERKMVRTKSIAAAVGYSSVTTAYRLEAKYIMVPTLSGETARIISNQRPATPVLGITPDPVTLRRMQLYWGVLPIKAYIESSTEEIIAGGIKASKEKGLIEKGDVIVVTAGLPTNGLRADTVSKSNLMQVLEIE